VNFVVQTWLALTFEVGTKDGYEKDLTNKEKGRNETPFLGSTTVHQGASHGKTVAKNSVTSIFAKIGLGQAIPSATPIGEKTSHS
jgi:hypothetical protein